MTTMEKRVLRDRRSIKPPSFYTATEYDDVVIVGSRKRNSVAGFETNVKKEPENTTVVGTIEISEEEVKTILKSQKYRIKNAASQRSLIQSILQNAKNSPIVALEKFDAQVHRRSSSQEPAEKRAKRTVNRRDSITSADNDDDDDCAADKKNSDDNNNMQIVNARLPLKTSRDSSVNVEDCSKMIVGCETKFSLPSAAPVSIYRRPNLHNRDVFSTNFNIHTSNQQQSVVKNGHFYQQALNNNRVYPTGFAQRSSTFQRQAPTHPLQYSSYASLASANNSAMFDANNVHRQQHRHPPPKLILSQQPVYHSMTSSVVGVRCHSNGKGDPEKLRGNRFLWQGDTRRLPPLSCPSCFEVFFDAEEFEAHYRLMHPTVYFEEYGRSVPFCLPGPFGRGNTGAEKIGLAQDDSYVPQLDLACKRCFKRNINCTGTFMLFR